MSNLTDDVSEGEIAEDFSEISSDDCYFENLKKLHHRKLELELENTINEKFANDFGKENRYSTNRHRPSETSSERRKRRIKSGSRNESSKDVKRSRFYRASSVVSNFSSISKRRTRSTRKSSRKQSRETTRKDYGKEVSIVIDQDDSSDENDEELLELRLNALKSKQEVREMIDEVEHLPVETPPKEPTEEDKLRILALRSQLLSKKDFFKERKKLKMMERERPYSPSDDLAPIVVDDDDAMVMSPLGSPFNEIEVNEEVDMEISNSPMNEEKETSDMDIAPSPNEIQNDVEEPSSDEENALRSLLLTTITKKKNVPVSIPTKEASPAPESNLAMNLKLAVQRLKQKKQMSIPTTGPKSGTKTIAMILSEQAEKMKKKLESSSEKPSEISENPITAIIHPHVEIISEIEAAVSPCILISDSPVETSAQSSPNDSNNETRRTPQPFDNNFSTITDTKNIPLLPSSDKRKSRLITSLESVQKPVARLVITVTADSDSDREINATIQKTATRIVRAPPVSIKPKPHLSAAPPEFEKNLDNFLKRVRMEQEQGTQDKAPAQTKATPAVTKASSSVRNLPRSSQLEYEQLLEKMRILEEAKKERLKARQLKRTRSNSGKSETAVTTQPVSKPTETKAAEPKLLNKVTDTISKISQLDKAAQLRMIEKTENNYKKHSNNLMDSIEQSLKLLENNELDMQKQTKLSTEIIELERKLKKYKATLNIVNTRVKVNYHKIVQSQREMIKRRIHLKGFGKICLQVGTMAYGDEGYSLPVIESDKIDESLQKVSAKTDDIMKATSDQTVKNNMKLLSERVKTLIVPVKQKSLENPKESQNDTIIENSSAKEKHPINSEIPSNMTQQNNLEEESAVMKLIRENQTRDLTVEESPIEVNFPEIQIKTTILDIDDSRKKRLTSPQKEFNIAKKLRRYESPLEFLKLSKNKTTSVNMILCPYQFEGGTCSGDQCKMMHI